ncbi:MAG TPA: VWA domain-containing protein [Actinomycetota bacterium]|nr:VWA domain-containing protein [Actinomycetota bacterium]
MRFANPAGLLLGLLAIPVVLLHMLRPRRRAVEVSSTFLWSRVQRTVSAAVPWQRLPPTLLLALQLLAVALLALGASRPVRVTDAPLSPHTVFIFDSSGSMGALDGRPDRTALARAEALRLHRQLPAQGLASVVIASSRPQVVLSTSPDASSFRDAVDAIKPTAGAADFATAFTLAESLETPEAPVGFVLLSDGGLTEDQRRLIPPGTKWVKTGSKRNNLALTRLTVEPRGAGIHARVTLRNTGTRDARRTLRLSVDGAQAVDTFVVVRPGATIERELDLPQGDRVRASLTGSDLLRSDDSAYAVAGRRPAVRVMHAGPDNPYLDRLLAAIPGVQVERSPASRPAPGFDLAIYDRVEVPRDPAAPVWAIAPPGGMDGIHVAGEVEQPAVTLVETGDDLLEGLDLSGVGIAKAQRLVPEGDEVLVGAEGAPLLVRGIRSGRPVVYLAFALDQSNLPLQIAFPVLGDRLVTALTGAAPPPADLRSGQPLPIAQTGRELVVSGPGQPSIDLPPGAAPPLASAPGFWTVKEKTADGAPRGTERVLAVNADPAESSIAPADSLPQPARARDRGQRRPAGELPLLPWVAGILAVVMGAELWLSRRSAGVSARQWRWALGVRALIALLLIGSVLGFAVPRTGKHVATVFLVDASDSMGQDGVAAAVDWVQDALRRQTPESRAGVAFFGGDARLEHVVQPELELQGQHVKVEASQTDLAEALRLAEAVLPSDARRRVVVVSDGRPTEGDAATEATRLRESGIAVDVHPIRRGGGADVAVARVDTPSVAREGDAYSVRVTLASTVQTAVRVELERDGKTVDARAVDVQPGESVVEFPQSAGPPGLIRYVVRLTAQSDAIKENDIGFAAVRVEGPARVLLAEGRPGAAAPLAGALGAGGIRTETVAAGALPALDVLSTFSAIALVDVDRASLSDNQVASLGSATRDLGRGLVAIAGDQSFALGGYLDSDLEKLLPIVSDIKDPKKRQPVAQILVIDSSGSMSQGGQQGAQAIDLAKAAAAQALKTLKPTDEVGIIAFNSQPRWLLQLQRNPGEDATVSALQGLRADGGTALLAPLQQAGEALKASKASRKHVIMLSDGQTGEPGLREEAARIAKTGVTVSSIGIGSGFDPGQMQGIAEGGKGRFYAATDPAQVPKLLTQETVLASRNFVNEGRFLPRVVSRDDPVRDLTGSPPLLGYQAITAKPAASTLLDIGEDQDPLLATWRVGLGRATAWTSDAGARWAQLWAAWGGFPAFWSAVVKDTFPLGGASGAGVRATVEQGRLRVTVEREEPWPDGAVATARVSAPALDGTPMALERTSPTTFSGDAPATQTGSYSVGVEVTSGDTTVFSSVAIANRSYSPEYRPEDPDPGLLERVSKLSGGRGSIRASQAFQPQGLRPGRGSIPLSGWFLLLAALLWPLDVALRRLVIGQAVPLAVSATRRSADSIRSRLRRLSPPSLSRGETAPARGPRPSPVSLGPEAVQPSQPEPPQHPGAEPQPQDARTETLQRLLDRKRRISGGGPPDD